MNSKDETGQLLQSMKTMQANLKESIEADRRKAEENGRIKTALDNVSGNVMLVDSNNKIIYMNDAIVKMFRKVQNEIRSQLPNFDVDTLMGTSIDVFHKSPNHQRMMLEKLNSTHTTAIEIGSLTFKFAVNPVIDGEGNRMGTVVEWTDRTAELAVEHEVRDIVQSAQAGDLSQRIDMQGKSGFFAQLGEGINSLLEVSERVINDTVRVLSAMSQGNLTETIRANYEGTFDQLKRDANATVVKLTDVISKIKTGSESVSSGSEEISQGNANLSQRTEEQAASSRGDGLQHGADDRHGEGRTRTMRARPTSWPRGRANRPRRAVRWSATRSRRWARSMQCEQEDRRHHRGDRRDRLSDQSAGAQCGGGGGTRRRTGPWLCGGGQRGAQSRSAQCHGGQGDQDPDPGQCGQGGTRLSSWWINPVSPWVRSSPRSSGSATSSPRSPRPAPEQSSGIEEVNKAIVQIDDMTQQNAALVEQAAAACGVDGRAGAQHERVDGVFQC